VGGGLIHVKVICLNGDMRLYLVLHGLENIYERL
jgi:hypothetical protein